MPTVYLPLGSASASGTFGSLIVFQGVTCRALVVPDDPRTTAQLDVRHTFHDFTKMLRTLGTWGRAGCACVFGPQWFQGLYGLARANSAARWLAADAVFEAFDAGQKAAWDAHAPFQVTYSSPGRVWFDLARFWYDYWTDQGGPTFWMPWPDLDAYDDLLVWWTKDLTDALTKGTYDQGAAQFFYASGWSTVTDASAFGGSYKKTSSTPGRLLYVFFKGRRAKVKYIKGPTFGRLNVDDLQGHNEYIDQYAASAGYGYTFDTGLLVKGLHELIIQNPDATVANIDGIEVLDN
jgi:hypothetical protein